jgi:hypothetical protein
MITTKHGIKFSLKLNDKELKITPDIKKYFEECEKKICKELDKMEIDEIYNLMQNLGNDEVLLT